MKKFSLILTLLLVFPLSVLFSCKKQSSLLPFVSDLREDFYLSAENSPYKIKATYGYKENPYEKDGKVSECVYALTFTVENAPVDAVTRTAAVEHRGKTYSDAFKWNFNSGEYSASLPLTEFKEKTFTLSFFEGAVKTDIIMSSLTTDEVFNAEEILYRLEKAQPSLIKTYYDNDGKFGAEITARILVKNQKPYWYIAITDKSAKTRAFLMDGETGELLAVREIF